MMTMMIMITPISIVITGSINRIYVLSLNQRDIKIKNKTELLYILF
jgi:hypothetical protein